MERGLSKIIVFGGTGYIGRHIVRASVSLGHPTYVYTRPFDQNSTHSKVKTLKEFESLGVVIIQGELSDHEKLVSIMKEIDVVISAISTPQIMEQLKIIDAIKIAGNIKRFIPSDFGCDEEKVNVLPPFQALLNNKTKIKKAIEAAQIPFTYLSLIVCGTYFLKFLFQGPRVDSDKELIIYGSGEAKVVYTCEKDIGYYTIRAAIDPRTKNRTVLCQPPKNLMSQLDLAFLWEAKTGHSYKRVHISGEDLVKLSESLPHPENARVAILHSIFVNGDVDMQQTDDDDLEVSRLYPKFTYSTVSDLMDGLQTSSQKFDYVAL